MSSTSFATVGTTAITSLERSNPASPSTPADPATSTEAAPWPCDIALDSKAGQFRIYHHNALSVELRCKFTQHPLPRRRAPILPLIAIARKPPAFYLRMQSPPCVTLPQAPSVHRWRLSSSRAVPVSQDTKAPEPARSSLGRSCDAGLRRSIEPMTWPRILSLTQCGGGVATVRHPRAQLGYHGRYLVIAGLQHGVVSRMQDEPTMLRARDEL
ncbi:hypothetical protein FB567DRAFT_12568 [Paraphoma chrysanthemicola]|uniref:Uncharacterized protein n=1 Tax=Paraphoma chrysanthemicola TaxID=798071 RepID=A0A8K0RH72_9PLEO|nr:hypothetical protein FB567DRAFT_12568 [Paraphoma chrysanthemicola]